MLHSWDLAPMPVYNVTASVPKTRARLKYLYHALTAAYVILFRFWFQSFHFHLYRAHKRTCCKSHHGDHVVLGCQYTGIMGFNPKSGCSLFFCVVLERYSCFNSPCKEYIKLVWVWSEAATKRSPYNTHGKNKSQVRRNIVPRWAGGGGGDWRKYAYPFCWQQEVETHLTLTL
jgi:hypothetical protein